MKVEVHLMFAALAALLVPSAAAAKPLDSSNEAEIVIQTNDLNLASRDGQRQLNRRIRAATAALCPVSGLPQSFGMAAACQRDAYRRAAVQRDRLIAKAVAASADTQAATFKQSGVGQKLAQLGD